MVYNPTTPVEDMVVLVTDKNHLRHGQIAEMRDYDFEYGTSLVRFSDGHREIFDVDSPEKVRKFYRNLDERGIRFDNNGAGPESFQREFLRLNIGDLESLARQYKALFREDLPPISTLRSLPLSFLIEFKDPNRMD